MKLPRGDQAIVTDQKLFEFLLNRDHPKQSGHADLFYRLLGIDLGGASVLREALLRVARDVDATPGKPSDFGEKYEIRFTMAGPRGEVKILSIWIIEHGGDRPRLITAFVE